jgi:hypothetical protein
MNNTTTPNRCRFRRGNLLEGTVRRDVNNVRVSTQLVDAEHDTTIWADSYDRHLTVIIGIQNEVAQIIAAKLMATLSPEEKQRIETRPTDKLDAPMITISEQRSYSSVLKR